LRYANSISQLSQLQKSQFLYIFDEAVLNEETTNLNEEDEVATA
jgi:hypothetical protein